MQDLGLVLVVGEVQRAAVLEGQIRGGEDLQPGVQAPVRQGPELAERLADRPEHAEVANRGPFRRRAPLEDGDATAATGQFVRMGQADDPRPDHDVVESRFIPTFHFQRQEEGTPG